MENPIKKTINGIDVYYIISDKFKTITWSLVFTHPAGLEKINEYYFLSNALVDNMKKYPSNVTKYRYLSSLYGLDAFGSATNIGANIVNHFVITYPNEIYLKEETELSKKAFLFLNEMVTNPKLRNGMITKKVLKENLDEAKELHKILKSIKDMYSYYRFTKVFYQDKPNLQYNFPENDSLDEVTQSSLMDTYNSLFSDDSVSVFVTGNFREAKFDEIIKNNLNPLIKNHPVKKLKKMYPYNKNNEVKIIKEYDEVSQSRVYLGYVTDVEYFSKKHPVMAVFNAIFGGFDQSKLFLEIREKSNLAYYVDTTYIPDENLVLCSISCEVKNESLVVEKIKAILEEVQNGDFSDELFRQAKDSCVSSLNWISDSQSQYLLQHIKAFHTTDKKYDLEDRINQYKAVTREEVIEVANSLILDTVYMYTKAGESDD
ncbi:insulinase family protein [Mycoplasmatota bacterium WC30]